jgi:DNA-binding response OmpR family regulator
MDASEYRPIILVIEDDHLIRTALHDLFTDEGYEVFLATDGAAAIEVLTKMRPDLVTLDLGLPDVPGSEVLDMIRQSDSLREVRVIVLSAQRRIPERVRLLAQDVIAKPYETSELLSLVERLVGRDPSAPG